MPIDTYKQMRILKEIFMKENFLKGKKTWIFLTKGQEGRENVYQFFYSPRVLIKKSIISALKYLFHNISLNSKWYLSFNFLSPTRRLIIWEIFISKTLILSVQLSTISSTLSKLMSPDLVILIIEYRKAGEFFLKERENMR